MKLSTKGRYGLRALIDLALYSENETVSIASISARQNISESYLEQLVRPLRKAGFIESNDSINRTVDEMKLDQLVEESRSMKEEAGTDENTSCCI